MQDGDTVEFCVFMILLQNHKVVVRRFLEGSAEDLVSPRQICSATLHVIQSVNVEEQKNRIETPKVVVQAPLFYVQPKDMDW